MHLHDGALPYTFGSMRRREVSAEREVVWIPLHIMDKHTRPASGVRVLWETRKLRKIWLALLQEGILALLTFFRHIVKHRSIPCQLLDASQPISVSIEGGFEEAQRDGTLLQDLLRPRDGLLFELRQRHDGIHQ